MKFLYLLSFPFLFLNSCKTTTDTMVNSAKEMIEQTASANSDCPDAGECSVQVFKNKMLKVQEDGTGAKYVQVIDGDKMVVEYIYSKNGPEGTADGNYMESIQFEMPADTKSLTKKDGELKDINLLYTKSCFCRGEAGTYLVTKGSLTLKKTTGVVSFVLDFEVDGTSHKVTHISESVKI